MYTHIKLCSSAGSKTVSVMYSLCIISPKQVTKSKILITQRFLFRDYDSHQTIPDSSVSLPKFPNSDF